MRKSLLTLMCLAAMLTAGTSLKAQEITITLSSGWTWISCPMPDTVDFATALGDFTPMQGDVIKSQWGQATYINGFWRGGISQFYPGYGYHYMSNRTESVTVTFNTQPTPDGDDHDYVDLGLPSGTLWATCNVGANNPEDYGDYFAWGETEPKDSYGWNTYQYCNGSYNTITKYCNDASYGYNGYTDSLTILLPEDDAATVNWGGDWRMPIYEEWEELYNNTTQTWTTQNGVNGMLFSTPNGNSLFLPAAGYCSSGSTLTAGSYGNYWSSTLYADNLLKAWSFFINWDLYGSSYGFNRFYGLSVRPVRSPSQSIAPTGAINGLFSIGEGQKVYFSQGNLQYQASTNTWRFAENQWDFVGTQTPDNSGYVGGTVNGSDNCDISSTYNGWIDLFAWGTSGYNHGANCYQPWSTSMVDGDYYVYGSYANNLYDQTGQADWGYNAISNGGNQENQWRTLTQPEWDYVFNTRATFSGIRYAKANVNNVNGIILLPDNWMANNYSFSISDTFDASFSSNILTASQWSILEQTGAVFLPAAGERGGTSVSLVGHFGYYWSASCVNSFSYVVYSTDISDRYFSADNYSYRSTGFSVRLVTPYER